MAPARDLVASIESEYRRYKDLGDGAIKQLTDAQLSITPPGQSNSVAVIAWHIAGNLQSRFTDFLTTDGEKPWRDRDSEFETRNVTHDQLAKKWNAGWDVLFAALHALSDADLTRDVVIRSQTMKVFDALHRSVTHTSYHVGQIVFLAKTLVGGKWQWLSIPPGQSAAFNASLRK